ncbi:MAG: hypothetical protein GY716_22605 [bacterium]|nr:hypothetical protein [bacterium]
MAKLAALLIVISSAGVSIAGDGLPVSVKHVDEDADKCVVEFVDEPLGGFTAAVPHGPRTVMAVIVDFADETVANTYNVADPVAFVAGVLYDNTRNTAGVIAEASFGLTTLVSDADGDMLHDIFHVTIPSSIIGAECTYHTWSNEADTELQALGVDLGLYQHRMYVLPKVSGVCSSWSGRGQLGCSSSCRTWMRTTRATTYAHEIGHNLGLHHASTDPDNDGTINSEYGDLSDIMGSSSIWRQFNGPHKVQMDWVPAGQIVDLFGGGIWNLTLEALETDPALAQFPQVVRISRPDVPNRPYYLSYRAAVGYDSTMSSTYLNRLQVHNSTGFSSQTFYITGLDDLAAYSDPVAHNLVITQLSHDASTVTIEIERDEPDIDMDGVGETLDCDDHDATVYPGAPEICDHKDNNCDEVVDEGLGPCDIDGDGFDELIDCNDDDDTIYPGAQELCDYRDNNCDGFADEPDYDGDGIGNCSDICPDDPTKGGADGTQGFFWCPCGVPEDVDSDGDSIPDCADNCPDDPDHGEADTDADGIPDCYDQCPEDPSKWNIYIFRQCPCEIPDVDSDEDGVYDCYDRCPGENDGVDFDIDGMPDCADLCPADPWKFDPGACGCGEVELDDDVDLVCDTTDNCPTVPNATQADLDGDGVGAACDCGPGDPGNAERIGPATELKFTTPTDLEWTAPIDTGGGGVSYDLLRSPAPWDFTSPECLAAQQPTPAASDAATPAALFAYLVRVNGVCGDHLGLAQPESRRVAGACP